MSIDNLKTNRRGVADSPSTDPISTKQRATTQSVMIELRQLINNGEFSQDERLPAERLLAEQFQASRGTIRSALEQLEKQKLVSRKIGAGTFVTGADKSEGHEITKATSPLDLIEVRMAIEPHMTKLVVANATGNDLERLADALAEVEAAGTDPERFTLADNKFHLTIAECSKNNLLIWIYKKVSTVREHTQWRSMKDKVLTPARIKRYNQQHRELFEAISTRHAEEAFNLMKDHLRSARMDLMGP